MLVKSDVDQIVGHGLSEEEALRQLDNFRKGFDYLPIVRAAVAGDGIKVLGRAEASALAEEYKRKSERLTILKFVPASGAATRMFKELFEFVGQGRQTKAVETLLEKITEFPFYTELKVVTGENADPVAMVEAIIGSGLGYGSKPKGLVVFHRYDGENRTAMEEHLVEGAMYSTGCGEVNVHFTVSPEHHEGFEALLAKVSDKYAARYGVKYNISFSYQKPSTDTLAVTPENELFREPDGSLLFRPAGHGALIENLGDTDADLVFIKTVDNVTPDHLKGDTVLWKQALAGLLLQVQERIFSYLRLLDEKGAGAPLAEITSFVEQELSYKLPASCAMAADGEKAGMLHRVLDRPIRVCGMVRNEGEPGGGPFWVAGRDGEGSLQIAESSQIAPDKINLMREATHFNPVDLVCAMKNYKGERFDLKQFVDPSTGFISSKSKDGRELKAQELPGLWNGAMADWNTIFVEVPISTFTPVKVVNDLLRPQHKQN